MLNEVCFSKVIVKKDKKRELPIWHHVSTNKETGLGGMESGEWAICQGKNHRIETVGDMEDYVTRIHPTRHNRSKNCACETCKECRNKGCKHPTKCRDAGTLKLNALTPKWDPCNADQNDGLELNEEEIIRSK